MKNFRQSIAILGVLLLTFSEPLAIAQRQGAQVVSGLQSDNATNTAILTDSTGAIVISGLSSGTCGATTNNCKVDISAVGGTNVSLGQKTMANSIPVVVASDQTPVGQTTSALSAPVVIASDQSAVPISAANNIPISILGMSTTSQANISSSMNGTVSTSLIAGTASNYIYVQSCSFSNDHASVDTLMFLQDGSAGNVIWAGLVPHGGGNNPIFGLPGLKVPTSGNGLFVKNNTTGSSTYASCNGTKSTTSY